MLRLFDVTIWLILGCDRECDLDTKQMESFAEFGIVHTVGYTGTIFSSFTLNITPLIYFT